MWIISVLVEQQIILFVWPGEEGERSSMFIITSLPNMKCLFSKLQKMINFTYSSVKHKHIMHTLSLTLSSHNNISPHTHHWYCTYLGFE